jgi:hypothetical protein
VGKATETDANARFPAIRLAAEIIQIVPEQDAPKPD